MAIQQWTIQKIGGSQGRAAFERVSQWGELERKLEAKGKDLPTTVIAEIDQFVTTLRDRGRALPTLFFCEYIDMWSVASSPVHEFLRDRKTESASIVTQGEYLVAAYQLPDGSRLKKRLNKVLLKSRIRSRAQQEDRWFIVNLLEAVHAWEQVVPNASLLVFRTSWAGSPDDFEVKAACI